MTQETPQECRRAQEELWASWPQAADIPPKTLSHARACADCRPELEALQALCKRSSPLSWAAVLPKGRLNRLAAKTKAALRAAPTSRPSPRWAPGLAFAAAALIVLWNLGPRHRKPAAELPAEAVEKAELLEHLGLLEDWDVIRGQR